MNTKKLIIINYNGPIVDSFENTLKLTQFEYPGITKDEVRSLYDKNIFTSLKELGEIKPSKKELDEYFQNIHNPAQDSLNIIPGMRDFFEKASLFSDFAINSSGDKTRIKKAFDRFGISKYFINILDKHDLHGSKENKFEKIILESNVEKDNVIFITDKIGDMHEAQKSGLKVILVTWGYQTKKHLHKNAQNILGIVDEPTELLDIAKEHLTNHVHAAT